METFVLHPTGYDGPSRIDRAELQPRWLRG
jgi:hypothetical protein